MWTKHEIFNALKEASEPDGAGRPAVVTAIINNKGGVGKTTTAVSLAAALAVKRRVLLIDLDSQCSATLSLGLSPRDGGATLAHVLYQDASLHRIIQPTEIDGLDMVAGSLDMAEAQQMLAYRRMPQMRLRWALETVIPLYDLILFDCPPSFSLISHNALVAADRFIVPVTPHFLGVEGLVNLMQTLDRVRDPRMPMAELWGLVLTMVDPRRRVTREVVALVRERFGDLVFRTEIPVSVRLAEAPGQGRSIFEHALDSRAAHSYWQLAKEVLHRDRLTRSRRRYASVAHMV